MGLRVSMSEEGKEQSQTFVPMAGVAAGTSRLLLGRIKNLKQHLKENPGLDAPNREAAARMLQKAESELQENRALRRSMFGR